MKTVFVTISDGEVSKSILQTDVFRVLSEKVRLVLLVQPRAVEAYRNRVGAAAIVEAMPPPRSAWLNECFSDLFLYSVPTESIRVKIEHSYASGGSWFQKQIKLLLWASGHLRLYRALCRAVFAFTPERTFDALFETYKPALVFAANLTSNEDARLLLAARRRGVHTLGMPKGWDNLTLKTLLPVFPDRLLVQTELMRKDAIALDYPASRITVVGFPKFDVYTDTSLIVPRAEFMRSLGLDPDKKLVLYAGAGDQLAPFDEDILADFLDAIESGLVIGMPQVLVRPHPKYVYRTERIASRPFWVLDLPGSRTGVGSDFYFDREDVIHLMNSLYHCDLLIHTASTLGVEASIFDRPSITLAYDHGDVPSALSIRRYYRYEHLKRVLITGGTKTAQNLEELIRYTNAYLEDSRRDSDGRKRIVAENAGILDGRAGERVVEEILGMLAK